MRTRLLYFFRQLIIGGRRRVGKCWRSNASLRLLNSVLECLQMTRIPVAAFELPVGDFVE